MKILPLQKEWEEYKRLMQEGDNLWDEGRSLQVEGYKLWEEGWKLWEVAVERHYGKDVKVKWRKWHKDNEPTCHVGSDVYV